MMHRVLVLGVGIWLIATLVSAQSASDPFQVFDTRPVIMEGPYLVARSETTATVVWLTDAPSHAKVRSWLDGDLSTTAEPEAHGLVPVGTRHVVHLEDLAPGTTHNYEVIATRVVKLNAYWPDKGLDAVSGSHRFTTLDRDAALVSFSVVTDAQGRGSR